MRAVGTKLIVVQAKKKTVSKGGIAIADVHQDQSVFGLVLSSDATGLWSWGSDVVWFNPHQLSGDVQDKDGRLTLIAIDIEAVLGVMDREQAERVFGAEFPEVPSEIAEAFAQQV